MLQKLLPTGATGAAKRQKTGRHAALTGSDLAFLPEGASSANGVKLAAYKVAFSSTKKMKNPEMKSILQGTPLAKGAEDKPLEKQTCAYMTARLLLAMAFDAEFGHLPKLWIDGKGDKALRAALAKEAAVFPIGQMLKAEVRAKAEQIKGYWIAEAAREVDAEEGNLAQEDPNSATSEARRALVSLFGDGA